MVKQINPKNIFVTGPPRCGKSTFVERTVQRLQKPMTGFFTREINEKGNRVGFSITTLDGKSGTLAHKSFKSRYRVGPYGVNLKDLDRIAVPSLIPTQPDQIVLIDEIGKMECFSQVFRQTLIDVLNSKHKVIGAIALKGDRFIQSIKERKDLVLVHLDQENRDRMVQVVIELYF